MKAKHLLCIYAAFLALITIVWSICFIRDPIWISDSEIYDIGRYMSPFQSFLVALLLGSLFSLAATAVAWALDRVVTKLHKGDVNERKL